MTKTIPANQLWFINTLVTVRVSISDGQDGISVLEHRAPYGLSPPWHLHRTEDEVFHVLEGEFRLKLQDQERRVGPGDILLAPKGVPHTYRVEWYFRNLLLVTCRYLPLIKALIPRFRVNQNW
jgi:quercetin dioxygenase-like cupin family protein